MGVTSFSGAGGLFNVGGSKVNPSPKSRGAYWIGQDGNVYVAGSNGVNSAGRYDKNTNSYWNSKGFNRINDPNPQGGGGRSSASAPTGNQSLAIGGGGEIAPSGPSALYTSGIDNLNSSVNRALGTAGDTLQGGIEDFAYNYKTGQRAINSAGINSSLKKSQQSQGILGQVGRNIQSGNVMLAGKNASDSSAAGALAQAYGQQGRRQMAGVGNDYALEQDKIAQQQADLADQAALYEKKLAREKKSIINNILESTQTQLQALNQSLEGASVADRVDIAKEIARVQGEAVDSLAKYDRQFKTEIGKYKPIDLAEQQRQAAEMANKGMSYGGDAFNWDNIDQNGALQDSGALPADLPLYTFAGTNKDQQQGV